VTANDRVMVFDEDARRAGSIAETLDSIGLTTIQCHRQEEALAALRREGPALALWSGERPDSLASRAGRGPRASRHLR